MNTIKNILEENISQMGLVENLSLPYIGLVLGTALLCGLILYIVYKFFYRGAVYSENYGLLIVMSTMTVAFIIMTISSNIVLSLGMVGALSIVRFRTAIKEPLDICFMFWSIAAGIVVGAGLLLLAVLGSVVIGVLLLLLVNKKSKDNPYILVVHCENDAAEQAACEVVKERGKKYVIKSKCVSSNGIELTMELRLSEMTTEFVNAVSRLDGVRDASLVSYNGDYMS